LKNTQTNVRINEGFSEEIKEFHRNKVAERAKAEGREASFQLTIDDIYAVSLGHIVGRPDYGNF
jgi:methylaspartate mutase epsilon subunit